MFSVFSAGCLLWLERLQPLFFTAAVGSLVYQAWLVRRRPPFMRTWGVKSILGVSILLNTVLIVGWIVISIRYR